MADRRVSDLPAASSIGTSDLFVTEQAGAAKKVTGQVLITELAAALDGHGGISGITYVEPVAPSLEGTLTFTMADNTSYEITITNGNGIASISIDYGVSADGTDPTTVSSWSNSVVAPTNQYPYMWTRISIEDITENATIAYSVTAKADDPSISVGSVSAQSGVSASATVTNSGTATDAVLDFAFVLPQGDKGDTGDYIVPVASYGNSSAATTEPSTWYNDPSSISYAAGNYIWRKTEYTKHDAQTVQETKKEIIGYIGQNGSGSGTVTQITFNGTTYSDDGTGNVPMSISPADVGAIEDPSTKSNGQVLTWDSTAGKWVAANPSTGNVNTVNGKGVDSGTTNVTLYASDIPMAANDSTTIPNAMPKPATATPADLGTAAVGSSSKYAREDHVHKMPSFGECQEMPQGETYDINTFSSPGIYFFTDLNTTLSNQPTGEVNGWLVVLPADNPLYNRQIWYSQSSNGYYNTYARIAYNGTWRSWVRFVTETDKPSVGSYAPGAVTLSNSSTKVLLTKTLDPGTYVITATVNYGASATGHRNTWITGSGGAEDSCVAAASGSEPTKIQITALRSSSSNISIELKGWQNSGGNLSATPVLKWVRVH